ncbi:MAG: hypothetical protein ACR2PT_02500 [Endozoicomonas sp.]
MMKSRHNTCLLPLVTVAIMATLLAGCASDTDKAAVVVEEACHQYWCDDEPQLPETQDGKPESIGNNGKKKMIRKDKAIPGLYHPLSDQRPLPTTHRSPGSTRAWP